MHAHYMNEKHGVDIYRQRAMHTIPYEERILYFARQTNLCMNCTTFQEVIDTIYEYDQGSI